MKKEDKLNLNQLLGKPIFFYQKYQQKSKQTKVSTKPSDSDTWPQSWKTVYFKEYPRLDKHILPTPDPIQSPLGETLLKRHSGRAFSNKPVSLEKLSTLLFYSAGTKPTQADYRAARPYPSAGSRYPLEIYLISLGSDLEKGLYHYNVRNHSLEILQQSDSLDTKNLIKWDARDLPSLFLIISSIFQRTTMKYGERGYRHILTEQGHLGQNFYLVATSLGLNICSIGGFYDDGLQKLLDLSQQQEQVLGVYALGLPK